MEMHTETNSADADSLQEDKEEELDTAFLSEAEEQKARKLLAQRNERAFKGLLYLTLPLILVWPLAVIWVLFCLCYRRMGEALSANGVFAPVKPLLSYEKGERLTSSGEAFAQEIEIMSRAMYIDRLAKYTIGAIGKLLLNLGRHMPCVIIRYSFTLEGKQYNVGKYMFSDELFFTAEDGSHWAIVHKGFPKIQQLDCQSEV